MANITIGNKSFTQPLSISGDADKELGPQTCCGLALGSYTVFAPADEGWNLSNQGINAQPDTGSGDTWKPAVEGTREIKITDAYGLTRTLGVNDGIQLDPGRYDIEVA